MAALVSIPPEPFYFPDLDHLDRAIQVWNKVSRKRPNRRWTGEGATKTYDRLTLPGYRHSVPLQGMLKEWHWKAFRDGQ